MEERHGRRTIGLRHELLRVDLHFMVYARHVSDPEVAAGGVNLSALSSRPKGLWGVSL